MRSAWSSKAGPPKYRNTAEYKFGDSFQFLNFAKHTFATNKIPSVEDVDDAAYYDRWIPIAFDKFYDIGRGILGKGQYQDQ